MPRIPRFRPAMIDEIAEMTGDGMTLRDIAKFYNIDERTIYKWANKYPGVKDALKLGREWQAEKVVEALFKRAKGYEFEEVKTSGVSKTDQNGQTIQKVTRFEKTTKHVAADPVSAKFLLQNILPERFRDKVEVEQTGNPTIVIAPEYAALVRAKEAVENAGDDDIPTDDGAT